MRYSSSMRSLKSRACAAVSRNLHCTLHDSSKRIWICGDSTRAGQPRAGRRVAAERRDAAEAWHPRSQAARAAPSPPSPGTRPLPARLAVAVRARPPTLGRGRGAHSREAARADCPAACAGAARRGVRAGGSVAGAAVPGRASCRCGRRAAPAGTGGHGASGSRVACVPRVSRVASPPARAGRASPRFSALLTILAGRQNGRL